MEDAEIYRCCSRDADGGVTFTEGERTQRLPPPVSDEQMWAAAEAFFSTEG